MPFELSEIIGVEWDGGGDVDRPVLYQHELLSARHWGRGQLDRVAETCFGDGYRWPDSVDVTQEK